MKTQRNISNWLWYSVRRHLLDGDLESLRDVMKGKVLEIGAGRVGRRGLFKPPIEKSEEWVYLDLVEKGRPDVRGDIEHLGIKGQSFDLVLCLEVLEYANSPTTAMNEIFRVLKHGGATILATPFLHRVDSPHDYWRFTEKGLVHILSESGFRIRSIRRQGAALSVVANITKFMINAISSSALRYFLGLLVYLPLECMIKVDRCVSERLLVLKTFSTGYLVYAVKSVREKEPV